MKKYIQYVPLTAFAAAIVLSSSVSAAQSDSEGTSLRDQRGQDRSADQSSTMSKPDKSESKPMALSDFVGMNIDSADDEKLGEIDEILIDSESGEVLAIVVSTGGFLGMGQQQSLISPEDLRFDSERTLIQTDISKEQIRSAPRYEEGETANLDQIRPLGTASAGQDRTARTSRDRDEDSQDVAERQTRQQDRTARTSRDRDEDSQDVAERQTRQQDRTARTSRDQREGGPDASDRMASQQERTERTERTDRTERGQEQTRQRAVSELVGLDVENHQGESIGSIDEVFVDLENKEVIGVVVSTGGFLGMGDRKTLFGMQEMSFDPEDEKVLLDYDREQIREIPEFDPEDQSVFDDLRERMEDLASRVDRSAAL